MDIWDKDKRAKEMANIKSKDTKPELIVRRYLHSHGYRYRKNVKGLPGTPDIVMRKYKIIIFIHGCFWHGHEHCKYFVMPKTRTNWWKSKIESNRQRDIKVRLRLKQMGWKTIVVWECQLKRAVRDNTLNELEYIINHSFLEQYKINSPKPYSVPDENLYNVAEPPLEYEKDQ